MNAADFDFDLPPELIAQHPSSCRGDSRMLVLSRQSGEAREAAFAGIGRYLRPGDCLVLNDTKVLSARLFGTRPGSGGRVEAFVLGASTDGRWRCLLRPGRRLRPGSRVSLDGHGGAGFVVCERAADGSFEVAFDDADVLALLDRVGQVPLPPYIRREATPEDSRRYQTVYAAQPGAVAAPTAGLHFTPEILSRLQEQGVHVARVTLHVGPGTFRPVQAERVEDHRMHEEWYCLSPEAAETVNATRAGGGRVVAVGTTSVRTLETCAQPSGSRVAAGSGTTSIFLYPPQQPRVCDGLLTNFHLPKSTLLMLVCCFSTMSSVLAAYRLAVEKRFRFYSYGDCMLVMPGELP